MVSDFWTDNIYIHQLFCDTQMHLSILSRRIAQDRARDISPNPNHRTASTNQNSQASSPSKSRFTFPSNQSSEKRPITQNSDANVGQSPTGQNSRLHSLASVGIVQSQQESLRETPKKSEQILIKKPQFIRITPPADEEDNEVSDLTGADELSSSVTTKYLSPTGRPLTPILKCPSPSFRESDDPNDEEISPKKPEINKRVSFPSELQRYRKPTHTQETEEHQTNRNEIRMVPTRNPFILNGYRQRNNTWEDTPTHSAAQESNQPKDGVKALMVNLKKMWHDQKRLTEEETRRSRIRGQAEFAGHKAHSSGGESSWKPILKTRPRATSTQRSV